MTWVLSFILAIVVFIVINCFIFLLFQLDKLTNISIIAITLTIGVLLVLTLVIHNLIVYTLTMLVIIGYGEW